MDIQFFLIFGLPNGGLFMARQLKKQYPNSLIYAIGSSKDIGQYSNTIYKFFKAECNEDINDSALTIKREIGYDKKIQAYIGSNIMLETIVLYFPCFFEMFQFENPYSTYQLLADKKKAEAFCMDMGIKIPAEYDLNNKEQIKYPVVIKPIFKEKTHGVSKCKFLKNESELNRYISQLAVFGLDSLNCQQAILGNNRWEYGYGGFFNDGEPLIDICFHQFRQEPQGLCCYIREVSDECLSTKIKSLVQPLLIELKYNGFLEFDIKEDEISHELYVLDINPRPWRSSDMLTVKLGGSTVFCPRLTVNKVIWRFPFLELMSILSRSEKNVPYADCKKISSSGQYKTYYALSDQEDKRPIEIRQEKDKDRLKDLLFNKVSILGKIFKRKKS